MRTDIPRILGHRGAAGHAPENTLEGIRAAHALGCRWVEVDCVLTKDREIVLLHDENLERTTDGSGSIASKTLDELRSLDAGSWFLDDFEGARVPTLLETFHVLATLGMGANLEIKPADGFDRETGAALARMTADHWPAQLPPPVLSSFSLDALEAAYQAAPLLDRAVLWWNIPDDWGPPLRHVQASAVHVSLRKLDEARAQEFKAADVPFRVYTVNDPNDGARVFSWGAEAIFTDYPDRFL